MSCLVRFRISTSNVVDVLAVTNRHLRGAHQCILNPPKLSLHHVIRRSLRTARGKDSACTAKLPRQESQVTPRQSNIERPVGKENASGRYTKTPKRKQMASETKQTASKTKQTASETSLAQYKEQIITADDLREFPFLALGVSRQLTLRLKENLGIEKPVEIQSLAIKPIASYRNLVIHSETGSGKTLAYLLPAIQQAKHRCHTIIAVPTRELAYQIYLEARKLAPKKDLACYVTRPGVETEFQKLKEKPPKIIIGTPKLLLSIVKDHEFLFSNVKRVITDEVDKMLPPIPLGMRDLIKKRERFPKPLTVLLAVIAGITNRRVQYIACSATITDQMIQNLKDLQWGQKMRLISSEKCLETTGTVPSTIKHNYVFIPDFSIDSKAAVLSRIFLRTGKKPILVFVHRDHSSNDYVKELNDLNISAVSYYKEVLSGAVNDIQNFLENFRTGKISVVVASEEEVRGLDFKGLDHVFIFDVPRTANDYLHIAGRVGRLGREGMVTTVIAELHDSGLKRLRIIYKQLGIIGSEIEA